MRKYLEILDEIDNLLLENGFEKERQELEFEIEASCTSAELCVRSGSKLLALQQKNKQVDKTIGFLIEEFVSYCHSIKLYPKSRF